MDDVKNKPQHLGSHAPLSSTISYILGPGQSYTLGTFDYQVESDTWHWSDEVYRIHGFEPGQVVPTTLLIETHKHPEDLESYGAWFRWILTQPGLSACHHRIIDAHRAIRNVIMIVESVTHNTGNVTALQGQIIDMTVFIERECSTRADDAVARAVEKRQFIEQAKGILMVQHQIDAEAAFAKLSHWSQRDNRKLRTVAEDIVASFQDQLTARKPATTQSLPETAGTHTTRAFSRVPRISAITTRPTGSDKTSANQSD